MKGNQEIEVYVIEKFDTVKKCFVFWDVVSTYKKAKDTIYKFMMEYSNGTYEKIELNDGRINEYDYFKGMIFKTVGDNNPITFEFRGHTTYFTQPDYFL